jgi:hypothetical protein
MFGLKRPTRIDLRSNDAAIVVRENGEMEMFIRQAKSDEDFRPARSFSPFSEWHSTMSGYGSCWRKL